MSSQYTLEPHPTAKVLLKTTAGDILLELFAKQTPLTSRNFLQLCLDGYYDGTIFHRLVPGFIIQGGDPSGTGHGGESIYDGQPFADEFHSRLKYNRRGLLGMANTGKDDNGSQFFLTLGNTPELTGKNTMFGRVVGDTIYNLIKMGEAELVEGSEKPLYPTKIIGTEILVNPFEDMVKRERVAHRTTEEKKEKKKPKRKAAKAVLSFGDGEEGDEEVAPVLKKPRFNPKLVSAGKAAPEALNNTPLPKAPLEEKAKTEPNASEATAPKEPPKPTSEKNKGAAHPPPSPPKSVTEAKKDTRVERESSGSLSPSPEPQERHQSALDRTNAQIAELKASMRRNIPANEPAPKKKSALESMIPETATRGRKRRPGGAGGTTAEEQEALDFLNAFQKKLEQAPSVDVGPRAAALLEQEEKLKREAEIPKDEAGEDDEAALCDLHFIANCQSCTAWDKEGQGGEDDDDNDLGWMSTKISFEKDRLGKDLEWKRKNEEEVEVIDPKAKTKEILREQRKRRDEKSHKSRR